MKKKLTSGPGLTYILTNFVMSGKIHQINHVTNIVLSVARNLFCLFYIQ